MNYRWHICSSPVPLTGFGNCGYGADDLLIGRSRTLHTDSYDEVLSTPGEYPAKIAIATQNILKSEAYLCDVIDPLGDSFYVEALTDEVEAEILKVIELIDDEGGMYKAVESGFVQRMDAFPSLLVDESNWNITGSARNGTVQVLFSSIC